MSRQSVAVVAFDRISPFHLSVPCLVFGQECYDPCAQAFDLRVCAAEPGRLRTTVGFTIEAEAGLEALAEAQTVIVPSWRDPHERPPQALLDALIAARARGAQLVGLCLGAFVLAEAGLLDGRRATTHWRLLETLQAQYPSIQVEGGPLYIQDGPIWTSGGVSSGFDLTLALVEDDYGFTLARDVAQDMVMYLRRPGGQLQFSRYSLQQPGTAGPIGEVQSWILQNLTADLCVENLAEKAAMSPRNFTRVFTREAGVSPARYVTEARLAAARQLLEQTRDPLERVAEQSGFGTSINLRRIFEKQLHLTPGEYRQRFHCRKMA